MPLSVFGSHCSVAGITEGSRLGGTSDGLAGFPVCDLSLTRSRCQFVLVEIQQRPVGRMLIVLDPGKRENGRTIEVSKTRRRVLGSSYQADSNSKIMSAVLFWSKFVTTV